MAYKSVVKHTNVDFCSNVYVQQYKQQSLFSLKAVCT